MNQAPQRWLPHAPLNLQAGKGQTAHRARGLCVGTDRANRQLTVRGEGDELVIQVVWRGAGGVPRRQEPVLEGRARPHG